jgi:hypothetical protein
MLIIASALLVLCGFAHSYLGERYLLGRLFRRDNLPHLFGGDAFTRGTLRFTWHITTLAWFGFAALLIVPQANSPAVLYTVSAVFVCSAAIAAYYTKGRHLSWVFFSAISALTFLSAAGG